LLLREKLIFEQQENKSLNLSQMTLSHEFRAPLSSTLMLLETLLVSITDEKLRKLIMTVISQINLLLHLVNDILDIKMIDQNKFIRKYEEFDPAETLKFVKKIFA
jgi:signal transduction histidine kinase